MIANRPVEQKLTRARTQLLLNQPFFGTLCLRLKMVVMPEFPTMATDGRRIAYNPEFVEKLTPAELEGVLAHEVMHCALAHHCRRGDRDRQLWNKAADYAINPILTSSGLTLPKDALLDSAYNDLSAEEIYARLLKQAEDSGSSSGQPNQPSGPSSGGSSSSAQTQLASPTSSAPSQPSHSGASPGSAQPSDVLPERSGGFGEVMDAVDDDGKPASPAEVSRQTHEWAIASEQALRAAKACGCYPEQIERALTEARESTQDWRSILRDFIAATHPADYRWSPPNRRFVASGLYLPSLMRAGLGEIVIVVDTSGSIGTAELEQFAGEITAINEEAQPERIHVVSCDAAVQGVEEFGPGEPIKLCPKGGGGTDFVPAFSWVEENGIVPKCLIYLTDLCCSSFPAAVDYPVLWVTDSRRMAPFGETVRITG
jgi:predicted metal-dependent peptidase